MKKIRTLVIILTICILSCMLNVVNAMSVFVEFPSGERITLDAEPSDSCENIKQKIQDQKGIETNGKVLRYNGVEFSTGSTIAGNNITEGSTLYLLDIGISGNSVFRKSATEASINFISNTNGTIYYTVNESPSAIVGDLEENAGSITSNETKTINISSALLSSGAKYVHIVVKDASNNFTNILTISMPHDLYYFDDFEAYNTGVYPNFFIIKHNGSNASLQKIMEDSDGNKVFNGYGTYGKGLDERIQINSLSTGYAVLETDISTSEMPSGWHFGGIVVGEDYDSDDRNIHVLVHSVSNKIGANYLSGEKRPSNIVFANNTNYHIKIIVDVANDKYDYYINGTKANSEPVNAMTYSELTWFGIYSGAGTVHYDNMKFYSQSTNPNIHSITKGTETNGTFTIDKDEALLGETITVTPSPSEGYRIKSVKVNDSADGITKNGNDYTFTMPNENVEVKVEFEKIPFTITANSVAGATITPNGTINVKYGDNKNITITANTGYELASVKVNDVEKISTLIEGVLSLTDIQEDKNITVIMTRIIKTVTIRDMENGTITSDKETTSPGETVTLTVTPNTGYTLRSISILDMYNDMPVSLENNYTFVMPNYNVFIYAEFSKIPTGGGGSSTPSYKITARKSDNGDISPNTISVTKNKDKKFTITPDEGYEIEDVIVDEESVGPVTTYTFEKVTEKHTIEAIFKKIEETPVIVEYKSYKDVLEKDWYYNSVMYVTEKGIMQGVDNDSFNPTARATRAMLVTILYNLENKPSVLNNNPFKDVNDEMWYTDSIAWAKENNIVNGFEDGTFGPKTEITREEMSVIIMNYMNYKNIEKPVRVPELSFADSNEISLWAKDAVKLIKEMKIMQGKDNNMFDALGFVTRAEIATMIMNFCENVK